MAVQEGLTMRILKFLLSACPYLFGAQAVLYDVYFQDYPQAQYNLLLGIFLLVAYMWEFER